MQQWLKGLAAAGAFWAALAGAAEDAKPIASDAPPDALEAAVTRMARIGAAFGPALSPDGQLLAYAEYRGDENTSAIVVQGVDGAGRRRSTK